MSGVSVMALRKLVASLERPCAKAQGAVAKTKPAHSSTPMATLASAAALARVAMGVLLCAGFVFATAPWAFAHGRSSDATNFRSAITDTPDISGVRWQVYGGDEFLAVTNTSATDLVVLGYEDEP